MQHIDLKKLMALSSFQLFIFSFFIFLSVLRIATSIETCFIDFCHLGGPLVRFPFRLSDQHERCGYPGFDLSCNGNDTIIRLPNSSGKFIVQNIDYMSQTISINDPDYCLPRRFLDSFSLSESPFQPLDAVDFNFFNCSSEYQIPSDIGLRFVECLRGKNFTVVAVPIYGYNESLRSCSVISNVSVPILWPTWSSLQDGVILKWVEPDCLICEERRGICGFKNYDSQDMDIGCYISGSAGLPRSAKYGIILGVAIPGVLCFIGLACYACSKNHSSGYDSTTSITPHPQPSVLLTGLDGSTIESFPKILLGESGRLPKPNDNTCPICLSEYQPKETLRTIPECNHYFHADCIDEWLKMNATCPLCRNSPDGSDIMTLSSSTSPSLSSSQSIP